MSTWERLSSNVGARRWATWDVVHVSRGTGARESWRGAWNLLTQTCSGATMRAMPLDEKAVKTWTHFPDVPMDCDFEVLRVTLFVHVNHCSDCGLNPPQMCATGVGLLRDLIAAWVDR